MQTLLVGSPSRERSERDDDTLIRAVRRGDDRAFEVLYQRYRRRIAAYIFGMVGDHGRAEDITQDVFISALRRMRETDRTIAFKPWIYEIAKNACIDSFRRSKRAEEVSYDNEEAFGAADYGRLAAGGPSLEATVATKQELEQLCGAFGGLSDSHHEILVLRELEGLSYREIGQRMGLTRPAVESTLFRARRRLTEEFQELATGARCERVQGTIALAAEGALGLREQRRLSRHLSWCQSCRRHARMLGVSAGVVARTPVRAKIAALLPIPAFLRRRRGDDSITGLASSHGHAIGNWTIGLGSSVEPVAAGWTKAAAAAATLALASVGAGVATRHDAVSLSGGGAAAPAAKARHHAAPAHRSAGPADNAFDQRRARAIRWQTIGKTGPARGDHGSGAAPGAGSGEGGAGGAHRPAAQAPMSSDHGSSSDLSTLLTPGTGSPVDQVTQTDGGDSSPSGGPPAPPPVDTGHALPSLPSPPSGGGAPSTSVPTSGNVQTPNVPDTSAPSTGDVPSQAGSTVDTAAHLLTSG